MTDCLSPTGVGDASLFLLVAAALLIVGTVVLIVLSRRKAGIVVAILALALGVVGFGQAPSPAYAADCPPSTVTTPSPSPSASQPAVFVTPIAPVLVDDQCAMAVTYTTTTVAGVTYSASTVFDAGTGIYTTTITASALPGFALADGAQTVWVFSSRPCDPGGGGGQPGGGCEGPECGG